LQAGVHLDLIGAFTPEMREADDEAVAKSAVFIDADEAFHEAGDLVQPIASGVFKQEDCQAKLSELCNGTASGRESAEQITLFKAVGTALSDLAAGTLAYTRYGGPE
jgi:ornithine cyclodeaminase